MANTGSALSQLKPFSLTSRSLYVKCIPSPRNFSERRAVLAALQKSTQESIETFKKLQDNSSFIVVTTRPEAATTLLENSPLERTVYTEKAGGDGPYSSTVWSELHLNGLIAPPVDLHPAGSSTPTSALQNLQLEHRNFTLHIFPTNQSYNHNAEVRKNPLHDRWPNDGRTDTYVSAALKRIVPAGAMAPGLRDWETGNRLSPDSDGHAENAREGAAHTLLGKQRWSAREAFFLERIRRRGAAQDTPKIMKSLIQFAEDCQAEVKTTDSTKTSEGTTENQKTSFEWPKAVPARKPRGLLGNADFQRLLKQ
ncbi:hypothetical protein GGS20DRAFT_36968 [Poronia punctata]|nr:hypothetical protein GGS20DRAFT_36968 [Poronia punctata]